MKYWKRIGLAVLFVFGIIIYTQYPKLNIIAGFAAKNMASTVFIADRTAASVNNDDHQVPLIELADTEVNTSSQSATSSVFGLMERKAVYRKGLGSVLIPENISLPEEYLVPKRAMRKIDLPFPFGSGEVIDTLMEEVDYAQVGKALDAAFANADEQRTRTVMILYKNQLIGERYVKGFDRNTPILGWSMTKSILATLYGILAYQGKIDIHSTTDWDPWQNDDRKRITYDDLLRMQSALEWEEDYSSISDVTKMLFLEADMGSLQSDKSPLGDPGSIWNYSSGTSNLLSAMLREQFNSYQDYLNFPYKELIDRIGMHSMILEADLNGTYVGSSYGWANTADWARFGTLYLNEGNWNGDQIFASEWVEYITKPTENSNGTYGAHFWLNAKGQYPDVPLDLYSANGYQGQHVFIIPSKELVVVRTGLAEGPFFDVNSFLRDILKALP